MDGEEEGEAVGREEGFVCALWMERRRERQWGGKRDLWCALWMERRRERQWAQKRDWWWELRDPKIDNR